jgi:putative transposase
MTAGQSAFRSREVFRGSKSKAPPLSEFDIVYLFVDGIAERLRGGCPREPVIAAWGIGRNGQKVLLHLMSGSKEDTETVRAFFQDMGARGLGDPILVASDGAPGRQRCLAHRMRNLAVKVPADQWPEFKARVTACYQAPSRAIARDLRAGIMADCADSLPTAVRCFDDDFEACIAHLRLPVTHRRSTRTTLPVSGALLLLPPVNTSPAPNADAPPSWPDLPIRGGPG